MTTTIRPGRPPETIERTVGGGPDEHARGLSRALSELIRVVQFRDRDRACCYDVSVSQCYALHAVVEAGGLTVNELAAHLYLDKSTASRIANGMVDKGLLARRPDASDGRVVRLVASRRGEAVHRRIEADLAEEYGEILADLEPDVRAAVVRVAERLARSFAVRVETSGGSCCVVR